MVTLAQVKLSNSRISETLPPNLVAVFAGATAGIGELALRSFVKYAVKPKVYFIGRSTEAGERLSRELKDINGDGEYIFLQADTSLIKNTDEVCRKIADREAMVHLLFLSQGTLKLGTNTSEGLPYLTALTHYSRMRIIENLLPLLQKAKSLRRVVSTFTGTYEGKFYVDDIAGRKIPLSAGRPHASTSMTLAIEALAKKAPTVSFIHNYPGAVKTDLIRRESGILMMMLKWYFEHVSLRNKFMDFEECGERHAYLCTSSMYPAQAERGTADGVPLVDGLVYAKGVDGREASGTYTVGEQGEGPSAKTFELLARYRSEGMVERVWANTEAEFNRILESAS